MTVSKGYLHVQLNVSESFRVRTENLDLVPASKDLIDADWKDHGRLSATLNASVPESWPPPLVTDSTSQNGEGWWNWYVIKRDKDVDTLIGMAGLKGWLQVSRSIQFGCAFLPEFQAHGYGTEAVAGLTSWALGEPEIDRVTAEVPKGNRPSASVLRKLGFAQIDSDHEDLLRFEKKA